MDTPDIKKFNRALRQRGLNQCALARLAGCGRGHLNLVLHGRRTGKDRRGNDTTRAKVREFLTASEIGLLGWGVFRDFELDWGKYEAEFWHRMLLDAPDQRYADGYVVQWRNCLTTNRHKTKLN